jgi:3-oxoacyl-(acyl-carrier-protein) synthase
MSDAQLKRVVVTGAGTISPLGNDWPSVHLRLRHRRLVHWQSEGRLASTRCTARQFCRSFPVETP